MIQPNGSISKECFFTRRYQRKIRDIAKDDNGSFFPVKNYSYRPSIQLVKVTAISFPS